MPAQNQWAQEPPDVEWPVPELDDGVDDPLLRPELEELELDEPEVDPEEPEPEEPVEPEPVLAEPEVPDDEPVDPDELDDEPVDPDELEVCEDDVPLVCEPGSIRVKTPAVTTLAMPTVAVVV